LASFAREAAGGEGPGLAQEFLKEDLDDFEGPRTPSRLPRGPRPKSLILIMLESTGTRYLSLYGSPYDTTPRLTAEAAHARVYDNFYCHVGLTANSMAAITLSIYPYMTWREYTQDYPDYPGLTLANLMKGRGAHTAFIQSGDLEYVNERAFMRTRGFDVMWDHQDLSPGKEFTSWGGEDRIMTDGILRFIDQQPGRPFYVMGWTIQTHHPYEPSPDRKLIDFFKDETPPEDDYDLGRYLNTLREADLQVGRLLDGLRQRRLDKTTLVAVTGDHGEAFGDPHATWGHGARIYEENVHVPFLLWSPALFPKGERSPTIGSHVDINPTLADLMGLASPPSWEGRSLFARGRPPRAYFYAANDDYLLGVREDRFKYIYNATLGSDEIYDLEVDPLERTNISAHHGLKCRQLRQRLAAWRDHAGRALARARGELR
jgi:arylsulfatase A-like enzyme